MADYNYLNLSVLQTEAMDELKRRLSENLSGEMNVSEDTNLLYRFMKARDFDVERAETMLKKALQWRKQNEQMIRNYKPPEILKKYFANLHIGYDKEKCPVFYLAAGKFDAKGLHMAAKYSDIEKTIVQLLFTHECHLERSGNLEGRQRINRFVIIFNDAGLTFANTINKNGLEICIRLVKLQQDIFPERLKAVFFINVPSYFYAGYNIAKNFLSFETQKKIHVYRTGWQDELLKLIDADQLPKFMGGTRTDPDGNPLCKTFLNQGGIIHESYFIHKSKNPLSKSPGVKKLQVSRSSSKNITFDVPEAGSLIEWEFETKSGDIVFGISYVGENSTEEEMIEVLPLQRLNTKDFSEVGMYKCEKPGKYVVLFDNSYSWFRSKEIYYRIKIVRKNELDDQINE